ncbi:GerAB/ArcD/ProY family transporter [Bacillus sp. FJAT-45350]|uniref:GerAB/ArcD/ProY family transporter n=1 Tax=Bacillus sp. FJAT-45350 TaxID=2011014 RepID=UPI000BB6ADA6|nr:GerAB/ArcD/ProY family transporter [Bacillus sp. FJAT-45350]
MKPVLVEKINLWQLFILIVLFELGSVLVVGVAFEAKQDAWIAILLATFIGIGLILLYIFILSLEKEKNLFEIIELTIGRIPAIIISFSYVLYFLYIASRVLRDFMELIITFIFPNTPIEVLALSFMIVVIYVIYLGIEVFARTVEAFLPYIVIFLILFIIFLFASNEIEFNHLQPVMAEGFPRIFDAIFPGLIGFPFGETIAFTVIMAHVAKSTKLPKVGILAMIASGLSITLITMIDLTVLGVAMTERASFSLVNVAREISLFDFIERIEAVVIFAILIGVFIKVGIFFFCGLKGLEYIFSIPYRHFTIPIGMIVTLFSILIAANYAEHIEEGIQFVPLHMHMPFQLGFPVVLAALIFWTKKKKGGKVNA